MRLTAQLAPTMLPLRVRPSPRGGGGTQFILLKGCALLPGYRFHPLFLMLGIKEVISLFSSQYFTCWGLLVADFSKAGYPLKGKLLKLGAKIISRGAHPRKNESQVAPPPEILPPTVFVSPCW